MGLRGIQRREERSSLLVRTRLSADGEWAAAGIACDTSSDCSWCLITRDINNYNKSNSTMQPLATYKGHSASVQVRLFVISCTLNLAHLNPSLSDRT